MITTKSPPVLIGAFRVAFCILCILAGAGGCNEYNHYLNDSYGYLMDGRSVRSITELTLEQHDPKKIMHGVSALAALMHERPSRMDEEISGLVAIYQKLWDGWPGLEERGYRVSYKGDSLIVGSRVNVISYTRAIMRDRYDILPATYKEAMNRLHAIDPDIYEGNPNVVRDRSDRNTGSTGQGNGSYHR